jgi:hypothetical protein
MQGHAFPFPSTNGLLADELFHPDEKDEQN